MDMLINSVNLLGGFSKENGFKYLTHRFDAESDDFIDTVNRCRYMLLGWQDRIPKHLYDLLFGFLFGPNWTDSNGVIHNDFCGCDKWIDWCLDNVGVHPMDAFYEEFEAFKNSIRIYNGTFDDYVLALARKQEYNHLSIQADTSSLKRLDSYVDVGVLKKAIESILKDINSYHDVGSNPRVTIACKRGPELRDGIKADYLCISHINSFSERSVDEAISHFQAGGGFIADLSNTLDGVALLSIESVWAEKPQRWNVIKLEEEDQIQEIEDLPAKGFSYVIRILHRL